MTLEDSSYIEFNDIDEDGEGTRVIDELVALVRDGDGLIQEIHWQYLTYDFSSGKPVEVKRVFISPMSSIKVLYLSGKDRKHL